MVDVNNFFSNPFVDYLGGDPTVDFTNMLEYKPQLAYYSSPTAKKFTRAGTSPARQQFFQRSFGDIYNEYLGELGEQIRYPSTPPMPPDFTAAGGVPPMPPGFPTEGGVPPISPTTTSRGGLPTLKFQDFLKDDPFTRRYTRMSPEMRGQFGSERQRTSSPTTRFIYY